MSTSSTTMDLLGDVDLRIPDSVKVPPPPNLAFDRLDHSLNQVGLHRWACSRFILDRLELDGRDELNKVLPKILRVRFPGIDAASVKTLRHIMLGSAVIEQIASILGCCRICVSEEANRSSSPKQQASNLCAYIGALVQEYESTTDLHRESERRVALHTWLASVFGSVTSPSLGFDKATCVYGPQSAHKELDQFNKVPDSSEATNDNGTESQRDHESRSLTTASLVKIIRRHIPVTEGNIDNPVFLKPCTLPGRDNNGSILARLGSKRTTEASEATTSTPVCYQPLGSSSPSVQSKLSSSSSSSCRPLGLSKTADSVFQALESGQLANKPIAGQPSRTMLACSSPFVSVPHAATASADSSRRRPIAADWFDNEIKSTVSLGYVDFSSTPVPPCEVRHNAAQQCARDDLLHYKEVLKFPSTVDLASILSSAATSLAGIAPEVSWSTSKPMPAGLESPTLSSTAPTCAASGIQGVAQTSTALQKRVALRPKAKSRPYKRFCAALKTPAPLLIVVFDSSDSELEQASLAHCLAPSLAPALSLAPAPALASVSSSTLAHASAVAHLEQLIAAKDAAIRLAYEEMEQFRQRKRDERRAATRPAASGS